MQFVENAVTVEDIFEDLEKLIETSSDVPCLYIIDSLDALSDRGEQGRKIDEGSYSMTKQKKMSEMFRRLIKKLEKSRIALIIISQIRDKIGVSFGETKTRSGGKALDFYASQVIWLAEIEKIKRTINKVERVIGVRVKATCKKNKVGLPFRTCEFPILFGYGVDDLTSAVEWLIDVGKDEILADLGLTKAGYKVRLNNLRGKGGEEILELRSKLTKIITDQWATIEMQFLPTSRKY